MLYQLRYEATHRERGQSSCGDYFDNVMTKFNVNNRTDAWKLTSICQITKREKGRASNFNFKHTIYCLRSWKENIMNITNKKKKIMVMQLTQKQWYKTNSDTINNTSPSVVVVSTAGNQTE